VQGVGFRPAVYRLASQLKLRGFVYNDTKGVTIELQGDEKTIMEFIRRLNDSDSPPLAEIETCIVTDLQLVESEDGFAIRKSKLGGSALSQVTADVATCGDCLGEMRDKKDFRYRYPFINCTNCGPRYSIVKTIPYDRPNTTMSAFAMCERCAGQYGDVGDRRFHAQPVACAKCGPKIWLTDSQGQTTRTGTDAVIAETARMLREGKIAAIKGVGGFHLAVDAFNEDAVSELRRRKRRDCKPFALMADSIETIKKYAVVSEAAETVLLSPQSPIVLLPKRPNAPIASSVAAGVNTFGFMLCYAPLQYMLFAEGLSASPKAGETSPTGGKVLVMTSGNIADEPLICRNDEAIEKLSCVADVFLMHEREIFRQVDDSIVHFVDETAVLLRRSRGYVPTPILIEKPCGEDIFAAGADLKNTFSFVKQNQIISSEHIGDLEDAEVYHHYIDSVEHLRKLFEVEPKVVVCDLHPNYLSTQYARALRGVRVIEVQHHWAHIASVLAEHNTDPGAPGVIGLSCDGTGYGTDGAIWGCECLIVTLEDFERFGHLAYYPLGGGDAASKEAIRPVAGLLTKAYGEGFEAGELKWLLERIEPDTAKREIIFEQIRKGINTVSTSSLGRVFDAVSAMVGLGNYNHFEAQLPMALEATAAENIDEGYDFKITSRGDKTVELDLGMMLKQIVGDIGRGENTGIISAKFHNTVAAGLVEMAKAAKEAKRIETVALSGGVFCNRYLANRVIKFLKRDGFRVLFNRDFPSNDGGISIGQAAIAAHKVK